MNLDWQSWLTLGIVGGTALGFVIRLIRRRKGGCASCGASTPVRKG